MQYDFYTSCAFCTYILKDIDCLARGTIRTLLATNSISWYTQYTYTCTETNSGMHELLNRLMYVP